MNMNFVMDMIVRNTMSLQIILVSFFVPFAHSITSVRNHQHATWYQASDSCGNDGLEYNESIFREVGVLHGKMFWLGKAIYSRTSDWIEILGCFNITFANETTKRTFTEVSCVAECQLKCWSISFTTFGYKVTTHSCVCSKNKPLTKTNMQACRSKTFSNSYFFYQVYLGQVANGEGGHCTSLFCRNGYNNLKAVDCAEFRPAAFCGRIGFNLVLWEKTFTDSLDWCMSKDQLLLAPLNYCKMNKNKNKGVISWTNVFRDVWDRQLTKGILYCLTTEGGNDRPIKCLAGQLVQIDGQLKLNKTKKECNEVLHWFVCKRYTQNKQTDLNTLVSILPPTKSYISADYFICCSTQPGAVIGALLGACSMIAVLSVLIVCKIRSKGLFTESNNHVYEDTADQVISSKTIYDDVVNNTRNKNTTTASTQTYDIHESSSPVYNNIDESKYDNV